MAVCDKWVALKILEFLSCVACLVAKRISSDDEARLALLLQKFSREWSLLTSVTWDSVGGAFADAVYGGYTIITFGLILARIFQEIPKGRRILEGVLLGLGFLFFLILGGLELASLDSVPRNLVVNASVLGSLSLLVAILFLIDLMGPRVYTKTSHSQTDTAISIAKPDEKISVTNQTNVTTQSNTNGTLHEKTNGKVPERPKNLDLEKGKLESPSKKDDSPFFDFPTNGYTKFDTIESEELEKTKFGSLRSGLEGGNYVHFADHMVEPDRLHYEQELAKFNEKYLRNYLDSIGKLPVKEAFLPEPQTPVFAKVKSGRLRSLYDELSPSYEEKHRSKSPSRARTVASPTLQQLEDYLRTSTRSKRGDTPALFPMEPIEERDREGGEVSDRASGTPTDPGFVQYTAGRWPDKRQIRTPRHSPTK